MTDDGCAGQPRAWAGSSGQGSPRREKVPRDARIVLVERLRAQRSEIDDAIFSRVSAQRFDQTGSDDSEYVAGLRAAGAAALDYVLAGIEHWGESLEPVPAEVLEQARRAARIGVGMETVLRRYFAGNAVVGDFVMREAERGVLSGRHAAPREVIAIVSALVDRLTAAVSGAYNKEKQRQVENTGLVDNGGRASGKDRDEKRLDRMGFGMNRGLIGDAVVEMRRQRILQAMVEVAAERGFVGASVSLVAARAGVSTRTFYEEFAGLQECFTAVLDLGLERATELIVEAFARAERWQDGVLGALASLLVFLESESLLARMWFVEVMAAGGWALERREYIAGQLRSLMVEYWVARGEQPPEPVAAMGVMASVLGLIQSRLFNDEQDRLIGLLGPLMGLITPLFLDKHEVEQEVERGAQLARDIQAGVADWPVVAATVSRGVQVLFPTSIANPTAHRLRACVICLAEHPGISNQAVGSVAGIPHKSQVSQLLSQLESDGIALKVSGPPGRPNDWRLTSYGEEIARVLIDQPGGRITGE